MNQRRVSDEETSALTNFLEDLQKSIETRLTILYWSVASQLRRDDIFPVVEKIDGVQQVFFATFDELRPESLSKLFERCRSGRAVLVIDLADDTNYVLKQIQSPFAIPLVAADLRAELPSTEWPKTLLALSVGQLAGVIYRWQVLVLLATTEQMDKPALPVPFADLQEPSDDDATVLQTHLDEREIEDSDDANATVRKSDEIQAIDLFGFRIQSLTFDDRKWEQNTEKIQLALGMLTGLLCRGAQRLPGRKSINSINETGWSFGLMLPDASDLLRRWQDEDFDFDEASESFSEIIRNFGINADSAAVANTGYGDIQRWRVLLCAASLARRFATRAFEGRPCIANIVLLGKQLQDRPENENEKAPYLPSGTVVFTYAKEIRKRFFGDGVLDKDVLPTRACCHFGDYEFVHDDIELGQSEDMFYIVDADSGTILRIEASAIANASTPESRHDRLSHLTKPGGKFDTYDRQCVVLAMFPVGYVEVYFRGRFQLWHDRYHWRSEPFRRLELLLTQYHSEKCKVPEFRKAAERVYKSLPLFIGAIGRLMDGWHSSILVFCNTDEFHRLHNDPEPLLEPLRSSRPDLEARISITKMTLGALVTILRLDGAHFFDGDMLIGISRRVTVKRDNQSGGTGRAAAKELAKSISSPGFVLKVSASGELKIIPGIKKNDV